MALSNLSNDLILTVENFTNNYTTLFKKDMILVHLLGKYFHSFKIKKNHF